MATPAQKSLMLEKYDFYKLINFVLLIIDIVCFALLPFCPKCIISDLLSALAIGLLIYFITAWLPKTLDYILFCKNYRSEIQRFLWNIHELALINIKSFDIVDSNSSAGVANGIENNYDKLHAPLFYEVRYFSDSRKGPIRVASLNEYNKVMAKKITKQSKQLINHESKYANRLYFISVIKAIENCRFINSYNNIINLSDNFYNHFYDLIEIHKYIHKHFSKYDLENVSIYNFNEYKIRLAELNINLSSAN